MAGTILLFLLGTRAGWALDFQSSRTLSLAQSGRGGALLNDTITLNPALLGFQPAASISGTFNWLNNAQTQAGANNRAFNVSVIDGKNEYVNAGISFTRRPDVDFIHVGLAKRVSEWLSLGVSGKRFNTSNNNQAYQGQQLTGYEAGVSAGIAIPQSVISVPIQFGLTADNLMHRPTDEKIVGPKQLGGGVKVAFSQMLMLYGDVVENFSNFQGVYASYAGGAEIALGNEIYARGGLFGVREKGWSAGLGWIGPKLGISYGYQNKRVEAEREFNHAVTMDIFM